MRAPLAVLSAALGLPLTSCDLANPCTAGEGSFELFFVGDLEGSGALSLDAIPKVGGQPARLSGGGAYTLEAEEGAAMGLAGAGSVELDAATCARGDSTATLVGGHLVGGDDTGHDTGDDTGTGDVVAVTLSLHAQKGGWEGTWTATAADGAAATGRVVAAIR